MPGPGGSEGRGWSGARTAAGAGGLMGRDVRRCLGLSMWEYLYHRIGCSHKGLVHRAWPAGRTRLQLVAGGGPAHAQGSGLPSFPTPAARNGLALEQLLSSEGGGRGYQAYLGLDFWCQDQLEGQTGDEGEGRPPAGSLAPGSKLLHQVPKEPSPWGLRGTLTLDHLGVRGT